MLGIRNFVGKAANTVITSSAALITVGLSVAIAAGQRLKFTAWVPITVGATGGVRAQVVIPAGGTSFINSILLVNTVAPSVVSAAQTASAAFTNALANAGTHWLQIEGECTNGATAGTLDIQLAQNTSDALSLTVLAGASLDTVVY